MFRGLAEIMDKIWPFDTIRVPKACPTSESSMSLTEELLDS